MKFVSSSLIIFFGATLPLAFASAQSTQLDTVGEASGLGGGDLLVVIGRVIQVFLGLLGVIFLGLVIYAGFIWMTSEGNEEKVEKAINILKRATIGLVISLAAFAIASFVVGLLVDATGLGGDDDDDSPEVEVLSDALGSGGLSDHYPGRNATDVPRNTKIIVSFKNEVYIPSLINDYDVGEDATDLTDDTPPATAYLNTDNVTISCVDPTTEETTTEESTDVTVSFTDDLKTFVFDPPILGSSVAPSNCTVSLSSDILEADGGDIFTGTSSDGYEWSFEVSTEIDTTPPTVESVYPVDGDTDARNVVVQMVFSEAIDPTTASGVYADESGFTMIQVKADASETGTYSPVEGTFAISSGYTVVEFTAADACGTNSCGQTIYCLPGPDSTESSEEIQLLIQAATLSGSTAEAATPYDGVADVAGNSLDGNDDGTAGDDKESGFSVTDDIVVDGPQINSVTPTIWDHNDVDFDADLTITWDSVMRSSTVSNSTIAIYADPDHELWYVPRNSNYDATDTEVTTDTQTPAYTYTEIRHGTFVESVDDDPTTDESEAVYQIYAPVIPDDVQSIYQNCFYPAIGPGQTSDSTCEGSPYCCDGESSSSSFDTDTLTCP